MALYQQYTCTTANQYVQDFAAFAAANGWAIDFNGAYLTSYWRVHLHSGDAHFEMRSFSATGVYLSGCTGYTPATTPALQPGYSGAERNFTLTVGGVYWFVSVLGAIYFSLSSTSIFWGAIFLIQKKIGNFTGGGGFCIPIANALFQANCYASTGGYAQVFYNDQWSPSVAAGGLAGSNVGSWTMAAGRQPIAYNAGLMPLPVLLGITNTSDTTKIHPLGFAPGLYRTNGGDIYNIADELVIGSDTYLLMPGQTAGIGSTSGENLFHLGA